MIDSFTDICKLHSYVRQTIYGLRSKVIMILYVLKSFLLILETGYICHVGTLIVVSDVASLMSLPSQLML